LKEVYNVSTAANVSAAEAVSANASIRHFLLRRLHSLTGLIFGGYIVVHLLVNASLIEGAKTEKGITVFQVQVDKIHSLPFLEVIETVFIYIPIIFHTIYGIWITVTGKPNVANYPYAKNWFYVLQRVSALVLVFFILFHVLAMKGLLGTTLAFDPVDATNSTLRHLRMAWWVTWVVYPIGILAACYHLANGFWTAGITWGLTVSKSSIKRWGLACTGLFLLTLGCGLTALFSALL
jgi:succinate dehydrogenase / fumarate reductase, cytochrome b subunit